MPFGAAAGYDGVRFAVWAPSASAAVVEVDGRRLPMDRAAEGFFYCLDHDAGPASLKQLRAILDAARTHGYAEEDGYVTPGLASVATAVLDHTRQPIAAVAVTFPAGSDKSDLATHTQRAAKQIATRIRGVSP